MGKRKLFNTFCLLLLLFIYPRISKAQASGLFKNFEDRVRYYKIQLLKKPDDVKLNLNYARVFFDRKKYSDTALWICQKILRELDANNLKASFLAGIIYCNKEKYYYQRLKKYQHLKLSARRFRKLLKKANITWKLGHPDEVLLDFLFFSDKSPYQKIKFIRLFLLQKSMENFKHCLKIHPGMDGAKKYIKYLEKRKKIVGK
ncbi:tetratricopeptide repeat protein [Candidatus Riflebacteria bacterium]